MNTTKQILVAIGVMIAVALALAGTSALGQMSFTNEDDISDLMSIAAKQLDMKQQDAVFLLDDQSYIWTGDGRLVNTVHRTAPSMSPPSAPGAAWNTGKPARPGLSKLSPADCEPLTITAT